MLACNCWPTMLSMRLPPPRTQILHQQQRRLSTVCLAGDPRAPLLPAPALPTTPQAAMAATGQRCGLVLGLLLACSLATTLSAQTLDLTSTITLVTRGKQFGDSDCLFMKGLLEYVATEYIDPSSVSNPTSGFLRSECQFNHTGIDPCECGCGVEGVGCARALLMNHHGVGMGG